MPTRPTQRIATTPPRLRQEVTRPWAPPAGTTVIAAVSGGSDSVALLLLLAALAPGRGWTLETATLDHGLRAAGGQRDRTFVEDLANREGLPCHARRIDALTGPGESPESAARRVRRTWLLELATERGGVVALGHTLDDQAETLVFRLARGSGLLGAGAMRRWSPPLWRPLLAIRRAELRALLDVWGESWVEDETNQSLDPARNRIRHAVLPALEEALGSGATPALARAAGLSAEDESLLSRLARDEAPGVLLERSKSSVTLDRKALAALDSPLLRRILRDAALDLSDGALRLASAHLLALEELVRARGPGTEIDLPLGFRARRQQGRLTLQSPHQIAR